MRSIAFADFLIGVGILFVLEGLMFAAGDARQHSQGGRYRLGGRGPYSDMGGPALTRTER